MDKGRIEIISAGDCLRKKIRIPEYQRPYKWEIKNITDLLGDIELAIREKKSHPDFKYRIGSIILHDAGGNLNIVDGQQRMISLTLLNYYLDKEFENNILSTRFTDITTLGNLQRNYQCISEWFSIKTQNEKGTFLNALSDILEVVVIYVEKESEAFQLFDSQNTRGRSLDPHDLLKAYHLREMGDDPYGTQNAVTHWESKDMKKIRELFSDYLFPIWNWSRGRKTWNFSAKEIDTYKGISLDHNYTFARRAYKAMPCYQITEPFIAGRDFFDMVDHYLRLLDNINSELAANPVFNKIKPYFQARNWSVGLRHVRKLFKAAVLTYYDRFGSLDISALTKLFVWAFTLRIERESLSYESINKHAVGESETNPLPVFSIISQSRRHHEICSLSLVLPKPIDFYHCKEEREDLLSLLRSIQNLN